MIDGDDVMADDFIPDNNDSIEEDVDIHELLFSELTQIINNEASTPALLEWMVGEKLRRTLSIVTDNIKAKEAFEGLQKTISEKFGPEYTIDKLYECLKLADEFPDLILFSEIASDLTLDHLKLIIEIDSDMARTYYCELARHEKWDVETLKKKITDNTFEKEFGED
jgi:hypothetical protein